MNEVFILVEKGLVEIVFASDPNTKVVVYNADTATPDDTETFVRAIRNAYKVY